MTTSTHTITAQEIHDSAVALIEGELELRGIENKKVEDALYSMLIERAAEWAYSDDSLLYENIFEEFFI